MPAKKHIATITILVEDRQTHAEDVNRILTEHGHLILSRLGVNLERSCIEHCTALITIVVEGTAEEIGNLRDKLDKLYGIVAKSSIMTK